VADSTASSQSFLGRGWRFPIKPDAQGCLNYVGGDEEIRESIWIILTTAPGERQMLEQFGCNVHDLVFDANTAALRGLVEENVRSALTLFEPRIDVLDVRAESLPDQRNLLTIHIDYRIRSNNAVFNLVYPFFLFEGAR
jgi:phage baseplate assembly protein W